MNRYRITRVPSRTAESIRPSIVVDAVDTPRAIATVYPNPVYQGWDASIEADVYLDLYTGETALVRPE